MIDYSLMDGERVYVVTDPELITSKREVVQCKNRPRVSQSDRTCNDQDCRLGCIHERIIARDAIRTSKMMNKEQYEERLDEFISNQQRKDDLVEKSIEQWIADLEREKKQCEERILVITGAVEAYQQVLKLTNK